MLEPTHTINITNFISKITPNLKLKSPSPSTTSTRKDSIQCLRSLQKRLESINRDQIQEGNQKQNRQLEGEQRKEADNQALEGFTNKHPSDFMTNIKRNVYEVYRQALAKKKEFLKKMMADEENTLWKSSLTESHEQNRPRQQTISCNSSLVNSRTRKQSLSGLSFIKKKYTFNNHLLVPMVDNCSFSKLKLERIHKTPLKEPRRNLQANSKIKESIRDRRLDYKPLFKVKQIQRERLPSLGVDARRIKLPSACIKEQNEPRKRRIRTEACTVERERPTQKAQFNSTSKFIGWETDSQEDIPSLMERH